MRDDARRLTEMRQDRQGQGEQTKGERVSRRREETEETEETRWRLVRFNLKGACPAALPAEELGVCECAFFTAAHSWTHLGLVLDVRCSKVL